MKYTLLLSSRNILLLYRSNSWCSSIFIYIEKEQQRRVIIALCIRIVITRSSIEKKKKNKEKHIREKLNDCLTGDGHITKWFSRKKQQQQRKENRSSMAEENKNKNQTFSLLASDINKIKKCNTTNYTTKQTCNQHNLQ